MTSSSVSYTKSFRSKIDLQTINNNSIKKDGVLQKFIDCIPKSTADAQDYLSYMFTFIFSERDHSMALNKEQKECIKYLCSNERTLFSKSVTRGQIKLWYIIYNFKHNKVATDFDTLVNWINYEKINQRDSIKSETTSFLTDLKGCKSYFDSIQKSDDIIVLGKKGYKDSSYTKNNLVSAPIPYERYEGKEGYRRLIFDNMIDPEKLAELKKKMNIP